MSKDFVGRPGYDKLWLYFGLGRASWLTLPRVLMHQMSDEWQGKMAVLLDEYDEQWDFSEVPLGTRVQVTEDGKLVGTPSWLINYRFPQFDKIENIRRIK